MKAQHDGNELAGTNIAGRASVRISGAAGAVGGVFLAVSGIMQSMQPPGCIAAECVGRTYRSSGPLEGFLFVAGLVLIAGATLGFLVLHRAGSPVVRIAAGLAAAGVLLGIALMGSELYFAGLALVVVGILAYVVTGAGLALTRALPAWAGIMLAVSSLLLFGANDQNERILFVVPFGVAWMVLGALLWTAAAPRDERRHGSVQPA